MRASSGVGVNGDKASHQTGDLVCRRVEREMTRIEDMHHSIRHIPPVRLRLRPVEGQIVLAPNDEQSWLRLAHPRLPLGSDAKFLQAMLRCHQPERSGIVCADSALMVLLLCQGDAGRVSLEAISLQPHVQLRPRQSEAARRSRFVPTSFVQDAFDHAPLDGAQITRR
jgi:hypothetical protein